MVPDPIKSELIDWLTRLDDAELLEMLLQIKKSRELPDWADTLSSDDLASISRGLADLEAGRVVSSKELWDRHGGKI